jgi:hypothetical protein
MLPKGIPVSKLNNLVEYLRKRGIWAERHSYSIRMIYRGAIVASLHLYPGYSEAVLRLYGDEESNNVVEEVVKEALVTYLPEYAIIIRRLPKSS